jgi:hypothetical protein
MISFRILLQSSVNTLQLRLLTLKASAGLVMFSICNKIYEIVLFENNNPQPTWFRRHQTGEDQERVLHIRRRRPCILEGDRVFPIQGELVPPLRETLRWI